MRVHFVDLSKACLKDHYPLPSIEKLIDATAGHEVCSLVDAVTGYHKILMEESDVEKIAFITNEGYSDIRSCLFLKNAKATYQRLVNGMFSNLKGKIVEVYIDDRIIKSKSVQDHAKT